MSTPKKATKGKSKPKIKSKAKSAPATTAEPGYAGHTAGSRKGTIHQLFDQEGEEVAWTRGVKIGLKQGTRSWRSRSMPHAILFTPSIGSPLMA